MKYARVQDGIVMELYEDTEENQGLFPMTPQALEQWHEANDLVQLGDRYDNGVYSAPPEQSHNEIIKAQIMQLEASVTPRRIREAILGVDNRWLADLNEQISDLRSQLG